MRTNDRKALETEMNRAHLGARRIDIDACWGLYQKVKRDEAKKEIDDVRRQMKQSKIFANIPVAPWKYAGQQSLVDVPTEVPFEQVLLDKTGILHPRGEPWVCEHCGARMQMGLPMDKCPNCGHPSIIARKGINLRN